MNEKNQSNQSKMLLQTEHGLLAWIYYLLLS